MSEYLDFRLRGPSKSGKTKVWAVENKREHDLLGFIKWHPQWRRYAFQPLPYTIFDSKCLDEITAFIRERMAERKGS